MKVKKSAIGCSIFSSKIGRFTVKESHADLLFKIGRTDLLEGLLKPKKLTAKKPTRKTVKKDADNQ